MTPEEEAAKKASEALYNDSVDNPVESFDEREGRAKRTANAHNEAKKAQERGADAVPTFEQLASASKYNKEHNISQRDLENMSENEANEYINNILSELRQQAIDENRIIAFTMEDEKGKMCKWEIKPSSLSTDKENCFEDGDKEINIIKTEPGKEGKQVEKKALFSTEAKKTLYHSIIRAPGAAAKGLKNSLDRNLDKGIDAAIQNVGR